MFEVGKVYEYLNRWVFLVVAEEDWPLGRPRQQGGRLTGRAFLFKRCVAVVTEGPGPTRRPGSTLGPESDPSQPDLSVYTLAVILEDGRVKWPVERLEETLDDWAAQGRLL